MKKALPADALIAKQAREDMERYVVEFIQFLTNEGRSNPSIHASLMHSAKLTHSSPTAAEDAAKTSRMVLYGRDILKAMDNTGFEHYAKALKPYLEAYKAQRHDGAVDPEAEDEGTSAAAAQRRRTPTPEPPQVTPS